MLELASLASSFYLPGVAPHDYMPGEKVELKVNKLTSTKTQYAAAPLTKKPPPSLNFGARRVDLTMR